MAGSSGAARGSIAGAALSAGTAVLDDPATDPRAAFTGPRYPKRSDRQWPSRSGASGDPVLCVSRSPAMSPSTTPTRN